MNTAYVNRLTVAAPESRMSQANHLAVAIGESAGDFHTFTSADWVDELGNKYAVASLQCTDFIFLRAATPLQHRVFAPDEWDFAMATQAQAIIELWLGTGSIPKASPDKIVGIVMDDPMQSLQLLGVSRING